MNCLAVWCLRYSFPLSKWKDTQYESAIDLHIVCCNDTLVNITVILERDYYMNKVIKCKNA